MDWFRNGCMEFLFKLSKESFHKIFQIASYISTGILKGILKESEKFLETFMEEFPEQSGFARKNSLRNIGWNLEICF